MIALKHNAQHVLAFESDPDRYALGQAVIHELGLSQQIDLQYQRFDHTLLQQFSDRLIFTETVNGTLFQEGLKNSLPRSPGVTFIPGKYFLEIHSIEIAWDLATSISHEITEPRLFSPGIDIDQDFITIINRYYQQANHLTVPLSRTAVPSGVHAFDYQISTAWGYDPHLALARTIQHPHAGYVIDAEHCTLTTWNGQDRNTTAMDFDQDTITFKINLPRSTTPVCLVPRAGMSHGSDRLMLDEGHWGPTPGPVLCVDQDTVWVTHDLSTGALHFSPVRT